MTFGCPSYNESNTAYIVYEIVLFAETEFIHYRSASLVAVNVLNVQKIVFIIQLKDS